MNNADRLDRVEAAANYDNGLSMQMARYSNDDVRWLCAEIRRLRATCEGEREDEQECGF